LFNVSNAFIQTVSWRCTQRGRILCEFEIAWYWNIKKSRFIHEVWNNTNIPPPPPKKKSESRVSFKTCLDYARF
jgi:hypothetical protein